MEENSSRDRSPFGQRMYEARIKAGFTQKQVCKAVGISQSGLSDAETKGTRSGYTVQLAMLYGVDPYELAVGTKSRGGVDIDQLLSQVRPYRAPSRHEWGELMTADLSQPFELVVMDEAFGGDYPPGCVMLLDPNREPRAGWPVLVKSSAGTFHLRDYQEGTGGRWSAVARATRGFKDLDSVDDGLTVIATMKGVIYP